MTTKVVRCKKEKYDVYIGRPGPYGNPFIIGKDGNRVEVCIKYKEWFYSNPEIQNKVKILKDKIIACWCHPLECHGHIIAEFLDEF